MIQLNPSIGLSNPNESLPVLSLYIHSHSTIFSKVCLGFALAISSFALGRAGFEDPSQQEKEDESKGIDPQTLYQPAAVLLTLRLMLGFIPAGILLLSLIPMYFYPITKESHREILNQLELRRKLQAATEEKEAEEEKLKGKEGERESDDEPRDIVSLDE